MPTRACVRWPQRLRARRQSRNRRLCIVRVCKRRARIAPRLRAPTRQQHEPRRRPHPSQRHDARGRRHKPPRLLPPAHRAQGRTPTEPSLRDDRARGASSRGAPHCASRRAGAVRACVLHVAEGGHRLSTRSSRAVADSAAMRRHR
eukprot:scaffold867_cov317-Prasinococcus_capsulatus_cf.AAC.3